MNVKNYRGKSADECMKKLKSDMGSDAVILQSRMVKPRFGIFGQPSYEIVAASDATTLLDTLGERAASRSAERAAAAPPRLSLTSAGGMAPIPIKTRAGIRLSLADAATLAESGPEGRAAALEVITRAAGAMDSDRVAQLEKQIAALTEAMNRTKTPQANPLEIVSTPTETSKEEPQSTPVSGFGSFLRYRMPVAAVAQQDEELEPIPIPAPRPHMDPYEPVLNQLRQAHVNDAIIRRLRADMSEGLDIDEARSELHDLLVRRFLTGGSIGASSGKMTLAAMVGPTGIGKTTTVAKLAAGLSISSGASVGMITLDTTRVAGTQQLQTYGEILGLPVTIAYNKLQMEKALVEFAASKIDIVLIDTPGRGPAETLSVAEMSGSLRSVVNLNTYLVLPATLSESNFDHTIQRFHKLSKPSALILTKMDETADNHCLGFLINSQTKYQIPLAYVTTGPRVPDDLLVADAHVLIGKLLTPNIAM